MKKFEVGQNTADQIGCHASKSAFRLRQMDTMAEKRARAEQAEAG